MLKNQNIATLNKIGQSIWYDNLSRDVVQSGELKNLIDAGVSGLTSNPTIFQKAISGSATYDSDIKKLLDQNKSVVEICEELMLADVTSAADLLKPTYDTTNGADGYASIEVSPLLAKDTKGTLNEALRLWSKLKRKNVMIKVPATKEGLPVITSLIAQGINVNVTLIFSVERYSEVMNAYLSGLEIRSNEGKDLKVASVASFFVSRVDSICEKYFDELVNKKEAQASSKNLFFGKIGIANSKIAYAKFEEVFAEDRFSKLKAKGAWIQRPLWASTGTKNPAFSPVLYIEGLAGADTVNTVPPQTLAVLMQNLNAKDTIKDDLSKSKEIVNSIEKQGLNFSKLLVELEVAGLKLFADSYNSLIEDLEKKCALLK
ncbi:MAG: transaldolase [bacterium]|nr:transaldolase [bacterium]